MPSDSSSNSYDTEMLRAVKQAVKMITSDSSGLKKIISQHHLNGTFKQLCDNKILMETLFPGTGKAVLKNLPKNLREVLQWNELELDYTQIAANGSQVLRNIKQKGAIQGDVMDSATEDMLLPQIAQEALANGLIDAVRKLSRKVSGTSAKVSIRYAGVDTAQAQLDQLDADVVDALWNKPFVAVQEQYFGREMAALVYKDLVRFTRDEKMTLVSADGATGAGSNSRDALAEMAWTEPNDVVDSYPALYEALAHMHALPYELNLERSSSRVNTGKSMRLLEPSKGCTMIVHYSIGADQKPRRDSHDDCSELDSGIRISCSYNLGADLLAAENDVKCALSTCTFSSVDSDGFSRVVPIASDSLMMHHSAQIINERTPATSDYFAIVFFIKGKRIVLSTGSESNRLI